MKKLSLLVLVLVLNGCAASTSTVLEKPFVSPQYGMSKAEVLGLLGKPQRIETYRKKDETLVDFYIYERKYDTNTLDVPVCLIRGKVAGWGNTFYQDHISIEDKRIK